MKTFILKLERHDDIVSVKDKMGWAKDSRILIVWPEDGTQLNRRLDLVLLQRASQELGTQIALVSKDPEIRYQAPRLGIPVYTSLRKAQSQVHWRVPHHFRKPIALDYSRLRESSRDDVAKLFQTRPQRSGKTLHPAARLAVFAAGVLALLAIAATLAPTARITLTTRTLVQDVLVDAHTSSELQATDLTGAVRSEVIQVEVEGRDSIPTSGLVHLPDRPAEGAAVFTNLTDQDVIVPLGTTVQPTGEGALLYATLQDLVVPAGPGSNAKVQVRSLTPGEKGNLEPGQLAAIEGLLGTQLSVANPEPISGGADREEPAPSLKDRQKLSERLKAALEKSAVEEIESQLSPGDLLIPSSLEQVKTIKEEYHPEPGYPSDQLTLLWRLQMQGRVVREAEQNTMVAAVFDANLPSGYLPILDSLQVETVDQPRLDKDGSITWKLHATRRVQAQVSEPEAIRLTLGLDPEQAASQLKSTLPLDGIPRIQLQPEWWPRLPVLPFRIEIIFQNQDKSSVEDAPAL